jgi:DNA recombination protein RmuC
LTTAVVVLLVVVVCLLLAVLVLLLRGDGKLDMGPFQQQLVELRQRLDAVVSSQERVPRALAEGNAEQLKSLSDVRAELIRLSESTARLEEVGQSIAQVQDLLKVPRLRGTLGELWLEELLRQVFPTGHYELQYGFKSGERVDAVIRFGGRIVPVDSKFPLEACQRMLRLEGDDAARERRAFHRTLKARIDEIADKYIRPDEGTYDFALMYIPAENVYYEAMIRDEAPGEDTSPVGYALKRKVIPVSPNTFYAYLAAILYGLRGLEVEHSAREIIDALGGMKQQFGRFERSYELVGKHLTNALKQHDETERRLRVVSNSLDGITSIGGANSKQPRGMVQGFISSETT